MGAFVGSTTGYFALCCVLVVADKLLGSLGDAVAYPQIAAAIVVLLGLDLLGRGSEFRFWERDTLPTAEIVHNVQTLQVEVSKEAPVDQAISPNLPVQVNEVIVQPVSNSRQHEEENLLATLRRLHEDDRPFEAVKELERLRSSNLLAHEAQYSTESKKLLAEVDEANSEIFQLTDLLENDLIWKFKTKHKQVDIFASKVDARDFKVTLECPESDLYSMISLIIETQFYKHWVPGVIQSERYDHSKFWQHLYLRFKLPMPFSDREALMKGYGDVWKGSKVMVYVKSVIDKDAEKKLNIRPGAARIDILFSGILLKPLEGGGVHITLLARLDLKLAFLPDVLFDYASKFVLAELCIFLRDRSKLMTKDPENKNNKRWTERQTGSESAVYREIKERLSKMTA